MYACLHPAHLRCSFWTVGIRNSVSHLSSRWQNTDLHLFFLTSLGATPVKLSLDGALGFFLLLLFFCWGRFWHKLGAWKVKGRCRLGFVIRSVFPARWTAVYLCCMRWFLRSSVYFVNLFWHLAKLCVWSVWCYHSTQRANHPDPKLTHLDSTVVACRILNQVETVFFGTNQCVETWVRTLIKMNVSLQATFGSLKRTCFIIHR